MKRQIVLLTILCILLGLNGCTFSITAEETATQPSQTEAITEIEDADGSTQEITVKIGELMCVVRRRVEDRIVYESSWERFLIWENPENYVYACIGDNYRSIGAVAVFSTDLKLIEADGIDLIEEIDPEQWVGGSVTEFEFQYGEPHFIDGNGMYIPTYISKNGTVYALHSYGKSILHINVFSPSTMENKVVWAS